MWTYVADGTPSQECSQGGHSEQPAEDIGALRGELDVGDAAKGQTEYHGRKRPAGAVDVCEDLGSVALLRKGG